MRGQDIAGDIVGGVRAAGRLMAAAGASAALWACLLSSGCEHNPFSRADSDLGERVPLERLRNVEPAGLEAYRKPVDTPAPDPQNLARQRFEGVEQLPLTLEECRASALTNNLDLKVALVDPAIADQAVLEEQARFEAAFTLRGLWSKTDSPSSTTLTGTQSDLKSIEPGVRIPLRTGGTVSVGLPMARSSNNQAQTTLNPAYTSDLEVSLSHQLLRGAGRRANTASLRIASYNQQVSQAATKLEVIRQLAAVDRAYWLLYQARQELEVRLQQYDLAKAQLDRSDRRVQAGLSAEVEVIRAQAGVAERLEGIIVAQNTVLLRQREVKRIINLPGLTIDTPVLLVAASLPDPVEFVFEPSALTSQAVANRMEMLQLELQLAADAAEIAFNRNQSLPLLSLDYTYRINGLGGSLNDSFSTLGKNNFEDWQLGLSAEVPLGNEGARARLRRSILTRLARLNTKDSREQSIRQEVLNAIDVIDASWQRVLAARQSVVLNNRTLLAEQRQFDVGNSTSTDVLDAAARLAEAQSAEIRALTDYQIAQVDLAFATGTVLGASKVEWEPQPSPKLGGPYPEERVGQ